MAGATALPVVTLPFGYAVSPDAITWTAADVANGNTFDCTGAEFVLVQNSSGSTTYHYTVTSQPDSPAGRTADEGPIAIALGNIVITQVFPSSGWASAGRIVLTADNAAIKFAVFRIP